MESKISLVGWGSNQVMLHIMASSVGVSFVRNNRVRAFSITPWLRGRVAVLPTKSVYEHGKAKTEDEKLISIMRDESIIAAEEAILENDILLLAEAVNTTYLAQQLMGGQALPDIRELGKRYCGKYGVYIFKDPSRLTQKLRTHSVLAT